ncbi:hypothetical protein BKA70DRAFT_1284568 [Coprinopsis sp. MPI-PUGE-AT-0042]|nr:hypothetical protein BKA70DRAFT_1284568 [Coprinopsis sp. MPI-PUGE-AT-0042]
MDVPSARISFGRLLDCGLTWLGEWPFRGMLDSKSTTRQLTVVRWAFQHPCKPSGTHKPSIDERTAHHLSSSLALWISKSRRVNDPPAKLFLHLRRGLIELEVGFQLSEGSAADGGPGVAIGVEVQGWWLGGCVQAARCDERRNAGQYLVLKSIAPGSSGSHYAALTVDKR